MPEFFNVLPPGEALALLIAAAPPMARSESVASQEALDRVTARRLLAPHDLPAFRRSTMDGYAVRAADVHGASASLPALLEVIAEVPMGRAAEVALAPGQATVVHTGGMIPASADAVVQLEHAERLDPGAPVFPFEIEVFRAAAGGQNVVEIGEDVGRDQEVLPAGHRIRPQDIGGLLGLGITSVEVSVRPVVGIVATGDEVVDPAAAPGPGQVRDINSYTIAALAQRAGAATRLEGIVGDEFGALEAAAGAALARADMLVLTAGSSVSARDLTATVVDGLGSPGVLFHGVATRPGKPTVGGVADGKPVLGLPGNPVSAMIQFMMFGLPLIYHLEGLSKPPRQGIVWAKASRNIPSESGREDYVPVRLEESEGKLTAEPVFGKSNLIYTLIHADGLAKVPLNQAGLPAGALVEVQLF